MKRIVFMVTVAVVMAMMMALAGPASATIHPIVESFDCANEQAFMHHPYGDPAEVPGQNPEVGNHSEQSSLRGLSEANAHAFSATFGGLSEHKLNDECGTAQGPK